MAERMVGFVRRKPLLVGGVSVAALFVLGIGAFALGGGSVGGADAGPALGIAVVAPEEPEIQAGERMGVGQLVNGFDAAALTETSALTPPEDFADDGVQSGWVGDERGDYAPPPRQDYDREPPRSEWRMVDGRGDRRGLGFDGPRPETGAEREARMGPPMERPVRSAPSGDPGATFY